MASKYIFSEKEISEIEKARKVNGVKEVFAPVYPVTIFAGDESH